MIIKIITTLNFSPNPMKFRAMAAKQNSLTLKKQKKTKKSLPWKNEKISFESKYITKLVMLGLSGI
jgi:hypothetical protein